MGFTPKRTVYRLVFTDPEVDGLEVRMRGLNVKQFLELAAARDLSGSDPAAAELMLRLFAESLLSWNVEDDEGRPVPTTYEAVVTQEMPLLRAIIGEWMGAVGGVPAPLEQPSDGGVPSPEASIPMDVLSPSPSS